MAEVALFHHAQGLTPGVVAFAEQLRHAGHAVHAPDLFEGRTFATLEEGLAHAEQIGFGEVMERGVRAVEGLPAARALVEEAGDGELFLYPGDQHLFADSSLPSYDADAAALLGQRVLNFLDRIDGAH